MFHISSYSPDHQKLILNYDVSAMQAAQGKILVSRDLHFFQSLPCSAYD